MIKHRYNKDLLIGLTAYCVGFTILGLIGVVAFTIVSIATGNIQWMFVAALFLVLALVGFPFSLYYRECSRRALFVLLLAISAFAGNAQVVFKQTITKQGKDYVITGGGGGAAKPYGANLIVGGVPYPIWVSPNGKYYIIRISKKTGKEYKQYITLP